jgi:hypothetical protein
VGAITGCGGRAGACCGHPPPPPPGRRRRTRCTRARRARRLGGEGRARSLLRPSRSLHPPASDTAVPCAVALIPPAHSPACSYIVSDTSVERLSSVLGHTKGAGYTAFSVVQDL